MWRIRNNAHTRRFAQAHQTDTHPIGVGVSGSVAPAGIRGSGGTPNRGRQENRNKRHTQPNKCGYYCITPSLSYLPPSLSHSLSLTRSFSSRAATAAGPPTTPTHPPPSRFDHMQPHRSAEEDGIPPLFSLMLLESSYRRASRLPRRSLTPHQIGSLLSGYQKRIALAEETNDDEQESTATIACLRLIEEAIREETETDTRETQSTSTSTSTSSASSTSSSPSASLGHQDEIFSAQLLQSLLRRCIRICERESTASSLASDSAASLRPIVSSVASHVGDSLSVSASLTDVLCETIEAIDQAIQQQTTKQQQPPTTEGERYTLPTARAVIDASWTMNLLILFTVSGRVDLVRRLLHSKRILLSSLPDPSVNYVGYIGMLRKFPGGWSPMDRSRFLCAEFSDYQSIPDHPFAIQADITTIILIIAAITNTHTHATPITPHDLALGLGFLTLLDEQCCLVYGSASAGWRDQSEFARLELARLDSIGVEVAHRLLIASHLSHPLVYGSSLLLHWCGSDVSATATATRHIWMIIKKDLNINEANTQAQTTEETHADTVEELGVMQASSKSRRSPSADTTPAGFIDVYAESPFTDLFINGLRSQGDLTSVFSLVGILSPPSDLSVLRLLVDSVLSEPSRRMKINLKRRLTLHQRITHHPIAVAAMRMRVQANLQEWAGVLRTWRQLDEMTNWRVALEAFGGRLPGSIHRNKDLHPDVDDADDDFIEPVDSLTILHCLDSLALVSLRTGDPELLDAHLFSAYPSFNLATLWTAHHTDAGATIRHAALWRLYIAQNFSAGAQLFELAPFASENIRDNNVDHTPIITSHLPCSLVACSSSHPCVVCCFCFSSSGFDPVGWLALGFGCLVADAQQATHSADRMHAMASPGDINSDDEYALWLRPELAEVLTLSWSHGTSGPRASEHPMSPYSQPHPNASLRIHLHRYTDDEIPGAVCLIIRAMAMVKQRHGARTVEIHLAPFQHETEENKHTIKETTNTTSVTPSPIVPSSSALPPPLLSILLRPPSRLLDLPSLPSLSRYPWAASSSTLESDSTPISIPFGSKHHIGSPASPSAASSSIHSYLLEEASAAWAAATIPTSLNEEDQRTRAARRIKKIMEERFRVTTTSPCSSSSSFISLPLVVSVPDSLGVSLVGGLLTGAASTSNAAMRSGTPLNMIATTTTHNQLIQQQARATMREAYKTDTRH